ncbi:MAG: ExbD/TolR family protein [Rubripirellula sp.]
MPLFKRSQRSRTGDVDMTSMVDVTFLLLIFFMVTASFNLQKSIAVPPHRSDDPSQTQADQEQESVRVQVDENGAFFVMADQWEQAAIGKQKLTVLLKRANHESNSPTQLAIEIHEMARLEALVDVLDAGVSAGFADQTVTQVEEL